jgi:hypothetical protein
LLLSHCSNNVDVIVFSLFENSGKQCADTPMGTYITPVPNFMAGYLENIQQAKADQGNDDWEAPEVAQYIECTAFEIENQQFYFQLGCADGTSQALAVNIYSENTCTNRSIVQGYDDSNIDVSALKVRAVVMDFFGMLWLHFVSPMHPSQYICRQHFLFAP